MMQRNRGKGGIGALIILLALVGCGSSESTPPTPDVMTHDFTKPDGIGTHDGGPDTGGTCPTGQDLCSNKCTDTQIDPANCGTCDHACEAGQVCSAGQCGLTCQSGLINCNGKCVDPLLDNTYCGASGDCAGANDGATCQSGEVCSAGQCGLTCQSGLINCNGKIGRAHV